VICSKKRKRLRERRKGNERGGEKGGWLSLQKKESAHDFLGTNDSRAITGKKHV